MHGQLARARQASLITKRIFKYDHANRLIQTETFTHQSANPLVTSQLYDALGRVILTNTEVVGKFNVSTGTVYQGNKPVLQFDMTEGYSSFYIQSFKWMDERGEVIASQATTTNDAAKPGPQELAATWHLNHLDGSHFVDTKNWHDGHSEFWISAEFPFAPNQRSHVGPDEFTHGTSSARSWHQSRSHLMKEGRFSYYAQFADPVHEVLNYVGIVDPFGVADGLNAVWYAAEGFAGRPGAFANASISAIGALVPYAGDLLKFGKAGKAAAESCGLITKAPTKQLAIRAGQSAVAGAAAGAVIGGTVSHVAGGDAWHGATQGALHGALGGFTRGYFLNRFAQACFTAGTPLVIDLEGNSKPIEEIQVGEMVLARNEFEPHGPLELKRVEEKFVRTAAVMELVIGGQKIKTTAEHPFYVPAQERFVPAGELQVGDLLVSSYGTLIPIESITSLNEITTVYNLRVADHHTYFVGGALWGWDVWVHNASYKDYLRQIEEFTGISFTKRQFNRLSNEWKNSSKQLLSPTDYKSHVRKWERPGFKDKVIDEWEIQTGQKWPVYEADVVSPSGRKLRLKGERLDAHHVIEKSYGGPHEWWNIHPARYPDIHQGKIHGRDGFIHHLMPQRNW